MGKEDKIYEGHSYDQQYTICRADPNFTAMPKHPTPIDKAFLAASYNSKHLKTLNVFLELVDIPSDKKMEYVKTVVDVGGQDDKFSVELGGFQETALFTLGHRGGCS